MEGFDTISMSWANPIQTVTGPEGQLQMPMVPMEYDQRSAFDAETFAG